MACEGRRSVGAATQACHTERLQIQEVESAGFVQADRDEQGVRGEHVGRRSLRAQPCRPDLTGARPRSREIGVLCKMECDRVVGEDRPHQAWDGAPCGRRVGGELTQCLVELLDGCCHRGSCVHRCLLDGAQLWRGRSDGLAGAAVSELGVAVGSHRKQDQTGE